MGVTVWGANQIVDYITGNSSIPATMYLALVSGQPSETDNGSSLNEPIDVAYARVAVATGAAWSAGAVGTSVFLTEIEFGPSTASWGNITHWALTNAATAGEILFYGAWDQPVLVSTGQKVIVPTESLGFSVSDLVGGGL